MPTIQPPDTQGRPKPRSAPARTALLAVVIVGVLAYCLRLTILKMSDLTSGGSPAISPSSGTVSPALQATAEKTVQTFLDCLHRQDYAQALKETASSFPETHSATALKTYAQRPVFQPSFAGPLTFGPVSVDSRGRKMILRTSLRAGGIPYRSVYTLVQENGTWLIGGVLDPVPPGKRGVASMGHAAAGK